MLNLPNKGKKAKPLNVKEILTTSVKHFAFFFSFVISSPNEDGRKVLDLELVTNWQTAKEVIRKSLKIYSRPLVYTRDDDRRLSA